MRAQQEQQLAYAPATSSSPRDEPLAHAAVLEQTSGGDEAALILRLHAAAIDNPAASTKLRVLSRRGDRGGASAPALNARQDHLGRLSAIVRLILNNCPPDDVMIAADRLLVCGARQCGADFADRSPSLDHRGVTAPRYARNANEGSPAQDALAAPRRNGAGSFQAYQPHPERARTQGTLRAPDEIIKGLKSAAVWCTSRSWRSARASRLSTNA